LAHRFLVQRNAGPISRRRAPPASTVPSRFRGQTILFGPLLLPFVGRLPLSCLILVDVALPLLGRLAVLFRPLLLPLVGSFALPLLVRVDLALPLLGSSALLFLLILLVVSPGQAGRQD
jgi:hypothetical protein